MAGSVGAPRLLHLGLEQVPPSADQLRARPGLQLLEERVVAVVVVLDDLERPPSLDDVPSDELLVDAQPGRKKVRATSVRPVQVDSVLGTRAPCMRAAER